MDQDTSSNSSGRILSHYGLAEQDARRLNTGRVQTVSCAHLASGATLFPCRIKCSANIQSHVTVNCKRCSRTVSPIVLTSVDSIILSVFKLRSDAQPQKSAMEHDSIEKLDIRIDQDFMTAVNLMSTHYGFLANSIRKLWTEVIVTELKMPVGWLVDPTMQNRKQQVSCSKFCFHNLHDGNRQNLKGPLLSMWSWSTLYAANYWPLFKLEKT